MFIDSLTMKEPLSPDSYFAHIPAVRSLGELCFEKPVTFLTGENGSGKSTLLEAIAVLCGFNAEGGTRSFNFSTSDTHSGLYQHLRLTRGPYRPKDGFFLRAESFYNVATEIERLSEIPAKGDLLRSYGGKSLHSQSHGESFLSLVVNRFGGDGLYLLDEPEAALSPSRQLALLSTLHTLVKQNSQLLIATHSPILMAYPDADILLLDESGIRRVPYEETEHYTLTRRFLENPARMMKYLFEEDTDA